MRFGDRVRELRKQRNLTQQKLAERLGVSLSYISKVENERLNVGDYPSEKFIHKLATELEADEGELLLLTDRVPPALRQRICEHPDVFNAVADLDDTALEQLGEQLARKKVRSS